MNRKVGFIGAGKMAQAMIAGILKSGMVSRENMIASAATDRTINDIREGYGIHVTTNNKELADFADILILAVKPNLQARIIEEIRNNVDKGTIIVTIAAGITLGEMEALFGFNVKALRTMPNTPSLVGEGMSAICANKYLGENEIMEVEKLFQCFGKTERLDEWLMDAVPSISGSSPAYVFMLIEAMADGGVREGIPRDKAYRLAAQAVLGAAKMVLETGVHPGALKDDVCTPGGATIEAVAVLEKEQFRGAIMAAMKSCTEKAGHLK